MKNLTMTSLTDILIGIPVGTQDLVELEAQKKVTKVQILKGRRHGALVQEIVPKDNPKATRPSSKNNASNDLLSISVFGFPGVFR